MFLVGLTYYVHRIYWSKPAHIYTNKTIVRTANPNSAIGGDWVLLDQNNILRKNTDFLGAPSLVYFGFVNCPTICPREMKKLTEILKKLGQDGDLIQPFFVTVDPERDTPEKLREYIKNYDERFIGLTGTSDEIKSVAKKFKVYYRFLIC